MDPRSSATRFFYAMCGAVGEGAAAIRPTQHQAWTALALHLAGSLAFGLMAADGRALARRGVCFVASSMAFALPVLGALGLCAVVVPGWRSRRPLEQDPIMELGMPELDP